MMNDSTSAGAAQPRFTLTELLSWWRRGDWEKLEALSPPNLTRLNTALKAAEKPPASQRNQFRGGADV
jgi:hypothetical protein